MKLANAIKKATAKGLQVRMVGSKARYHVQRSCAILVHPDGSFSTVKYLCFDGMGNTEGPVALSPEQMAGNWQTVKPRTVSRRVRQ